MTGVSQVPRSSRDPMSRFRRPLNANTIGDLVETVKSADRQIVDLRPYPFIDVPGPGSSGPAYSVRLHDEAT